MLQLMVVCQSGPHGPPVGGVEKAREKERGSVTRRRQPMMGNLVWSPLLKRGNVR